VKFLEAIRVLKRALAIGRNPDNLEKYKQKCKVEEQGRLRHFIEMCGYGDQLGNRFIRRAV
jgi:hypothetical protein